MYENLVRSARPQVGTVGKISAYINSIDSRSAARLRVCMADPRISAVAIRDALRENGFDAGLTTIRLHRRDTAAAIGKAV